MKTATLRVANDVVSRTLEGEAVILALQSGNYYGLDAVGTRIWELIGEHGTVGKVVQAIVTEYDVDAGTCEADVVRIIGELEGKGLIEVLQEPPSKAR